MSTEFKRTCDQCNKDITYTYGMDGWYLDLKAVNNMVATEGTAVFDIMCSPPIEKNVQFCGIECLKTWLNKQ